MLLGRRERFEPGSGLHRLWLNVGGSAGHSALWALDVDEGPFIVGEGAFNERPPRKWEVSITKADEARQQAQARIETEKNEQKRQKDDAAATANVRKLLDAMVRCPAGETKSILFSMAGLNSKNGGQALSQLIADGRVVACQISKGNQKSPKDGFKINYEHSDN